MHSIFKGGLAAILVGASFAAPAAEGDGLLCSDPGITLLEDGTGDVDGAGLLPAGLPLDFADIETVQIAQPPQEDGVPRLVFRLKLAALPPVLPPMAAYYISFKAPDNSFRGVRMATDETGAERFTVYRVGASNGGQTDGRFVESEVPAESGSITTDGTITITAKFSDLGIRNPGDIVSQFNAGAVQTVSPGGVGLLGAVLDGVPDDLSRRGVITTRANEPCTDAPKSAVASRFGGALGLALLLPLGFAALRRRA